MNNKELQDQTFPGSHSGREQKGKADPPQFTGFEGEGEYEEPDRDTDYTSIYREDGIEDEEFADTLFEEEEENSEPDEVDSWATATDEEPAEGIEIAFEDPDEDHDNDWDDTYNDDFDVEVTSSEPVEPTEIRLASNTSGSPVLDGASDWLEEEDEETEEGGWDADGQHYEDETGNAGQAGWPLGLIAVAIIALLLVMAGGYGVVQQRSATQEEIRQLQAALATSVSQEDVAQTRAALEEAGQRNQQLQAMVDALNLENRRLTDTVVGLEAQLGTQGKALVTAAAAGATSANKTASTPVAQIAPAPEPVVEPEPKPEPASVPEPTVPVQSVQATTPAPAQPAPALTDKTVAAATGTGWFVNFASYGVEATARSWVAKLDPSAGRAVITTGTKNGRTFYRVRVVDLPSRESADRVARELAEAHRLSRLWVGQAE